MLNGLFPDIHDPTYRIEAEIGSGGGGILYKAWHQHLRKHVVIKELKNGPANDVQTQRNEIEALKNVKSAYLPQVFGFLQDDGRYFTVMEFIEGESLDKLLGQGSAFTQQQIIKWYAQLASALETIHAKDICHRDIKPANIMLTQTGDVCLIDFNAALVSGNSISFVSRSLGYASPEQYDIYERYSNSITTNNNITELADTGNWTEVSSADMSVGDNETEMENTGNWTEVSSGEQEPDSKTDIGMSPAVGGIDWKLSDIFSLGAAMYHLLTGKHPPTRASEIIPIQKLGRYSEGVVFSIEKAMRRDPKERFASAAILAEAIGNIRKHDKRWKTAKIKRVAAAMLLTAAFALSAATALYGGSVMAQEKEEYYYSKLYDIDNGADPESAYNSALAIYRDRIDPYLAMAKRLWNDGDTDICREYIERNLGEIAGFISVPEAWRSVGDIYYILGNCYYYQTGEPNYSSARGNFEIAVQFVTDNPVYYRDYAITLARTGNTDKAGRILEIARSLNLGEDSFSLLQGEISYAKGDYESAVESFDKVIVLTRDDYLRYRAYHMSDEIFRKLGKPGRSVELLAQSLNRIPLNRIPEMMERLADAYIKTGDQKSAIALLEELSDNGAPQFSVMQNLAILLHNTGQTERAADVLERMNYLFPNDYRIPMRQAFFEAYKQSGMEDEYRDYAMTQQYYENAEKLYNATVRQGESDPEMKQLESLIDQLEASGWIG